MRASLKQGPTDFSSSKTRYTHSVAREGETALIPSAGLPSAGVTPQPGTYSSVVAGFFPPRKIVYDKIHLCPTSNGEGCHHFLYLVREGWVRQDRGSYRHHTALHVTAKMSQHLVLPGFPGGRSDTLPVKHGVKVFLLKPVQSLVHQ